MPTHQVLLTIDNSGGVPFISVGETLGAVRQGHVSGVVMPIEDSIEGGVSATLDKLVDGDPLMVTTEVAILVEFGTYVRPGATLDDAASVLTRRHATAQCRDWLAIMIPDARVTEASSTASAVKEVTGPASRYDAAICTQVAGRLYGFEELAHSIENNPGAMTRFVVVSRPGQAPERTSTDKTALMTYIHQDRPDALLEILQQFAVRGVNLCRIESRPTKTTLGSYCFAIDAEGHLDDHRLTEVLLGLRRTYRDVIFLGSYPRADTRPADVCRGFDDEAFEEASEWLWSLDTD